MSQLSKLQIRAKVLSVISEIRSSASYNEDSLSIFIKELNVIDDKETLLDIFLKEYIKMEENEYIRKVIMGYKLKEKPDERFYETMKMLRNTSNNLNQLAKRANLNGFIDEVAYKKEVEKLDDFIYEIKSKFLLFEKK